MSVAEHSLLVLAIVEHTLPLADPAVLLAALMHDAMEDCGVTKADLVDAQHSVKLYFILSLSASACLAITIVSIYIGTNCPL